MRLSEKVNVYEEIVEKIKKMIEVGVYKKGDKLPSVRSYAMESKVNPNTVAKAYAELEKEGIITIHFKKGAYVENVTQEKSAFSFLKEEIGKFKENGISKEELLKIIETVYEEKEEEV